MSEDRPHWGHGPRPGTGFRPPWWPEGEPFPPDRPHWRGMRRRFLRGFGLAIVALFALTVLANVLAVALLSGVFGLEHRRFAPFAVVLGVGLLVAVIATGRAVRRIAGPVADVMEAAERVAAGDYTVRVPERGPRDTRRLARSFNAMAERLGASEEQRRAFLADVAHELRTPLSVIQGNAEAILDGLYPADRLHLEPVVEETKVMARLLDDLQTLSTAEAGALRLFTEPVAPARLVEDSVAAFGVRADEAGVRLETRVAPGMPELHVDPLRIGQVLANLLSNAIRHTPRDGGVVVSADPGPGGAATFAVSDTGRGIGADALPHVFDRFFRSADSGGAGLGLAIARSLVEAHGGSIAAESPAGGGTTIRFVLPAGRG